jgi:hypothetical protein
MEHDRLLTFTPSSDLDPRVRRIGFELAEPYVEQCRGAGIGLSGTLLLRRLADLWRQSVPPEIQAEELSCSLGLGLGHGVKRLDASASPAPTTPAPGQIDAYSTVSPPASPPVRPSPRVDPHRPRAAFPGRPRTVGGSRPSRPDPHRSPTCSGPQPSIRTKPTCPGGALRGPWTKSLKRRPGSPGSSPRPVPRSGRESQIWRAHICRFPFREPAGPPVWWFR